MHAILSLYSMVGVPLLEDKPYVPWICWVIDLSYTHSWLASWIVSILARLDKVATNICFVDLHDIAILPHVKR
jgi:hypothetical protein